jgi:sugar lactone lactonase YvrE
MLKSSVISLVLAISLMLTSHSLMAQTAPPKQVSENVPALLVKANTAYAQKDYETLRDALQALVRLRPNNSDYMYQLVIAHSLLNDKPAAYDLMLRMQKQGLAYDFSLTEETRNLRETEVFDYVNDLMKLAGNPMGESEAVFELPKSVSMPETIKWDESRQQFLIGTVAEGAIYAVGTDGQVTELLRANDENGLWAIIDIIVDQPNNRLWVSSASVPGFSAYNPVDKGRSALYEFDLESLELLRRYPVPVDGRSHHLGSMVMSPAGDIYIADRNLPFVYQKPAGENKLKAVLALQDMVSIRGMAMRQDGSLMYVAGREMGVMVIDLQAQRAGFMAVPETLNLGGIDGMYLKDNYLYIIQNGIQPQRVMRLQLDPTGTNVMEVRPMAVAQPQFDYPSFGTIQGADLYYFANSQWKGKPGPQKAVTVLKTPLDSSKDLVQPDMELFLKKKKQQAEAELKEKEGS